jgi:hypothetical protein
MAKSSDPASELSRCAEVVERELRRLEELSRSARNIALSSEKNLARAARGLQQALEQQEHLARELRALGQAMHGMQARQEAAMLPLQARALELQSRMAQHTEHMQRFGALGSKAREVLDVLVGISTSGADAPGAQGAALLLDVDERVRNLVDEIRSMTEAAKADEFPEIAREAHALQQRLQAARDRLSELVRAKTIGSS